jgi:hypothetical protein
MTNPEKYTFNLEASACDMVMISSDGTKTFRIERDDDELPFTLVMNTVGTAPNSPNDNKLYNFDNTKITVSIEADTMPDVFLEGDTMTKNRPY